MTTSELEHQHLTRLAQALFPGARIKVTQDFGNEVIHLKIDDVVYRFEIGSDDDRYVFVGPDRTFNIPLMD